MSQNLGKDKQMKLPLILASTSPYRRSLLERLGYPFEVEKPLVDEDSYKKLNLAPAQLATRLAREKALEVARRCPGNLIIGGDQVAALNTDILGKPGSIENAVAQLLKLQGQTHQLYTALHLMGPGIDVSLLETTHLTMRKLDFQAIKTYVELDRPLDCAGAYKLESRGIKLFTVIDGGDHDAIVGLPLMQLQNKLVELGFALLDK